MVGTEEEAREKWCPMVRYSFDDEARTSQNRWADKNNPKECRCIVSECMMWTKNSATASKGWCGLTS